MRYRRPFPQRLLVTAAPLFLLGLAGTAYAQDIQEFEPLPRAADAYSFNEGPSAPEIAPAPQPIAPAPVTSEETTTPPVAVAEPTPPAPIVSAPAANPITATPADGTKPNAPVIFVSDTADYNEKTKDIVLRGNVEMSQTDKAGTHIVKADQLTYNQETKILTATGHVAIIEPAGDVVFADSFTLSDDMANGFAENIGALLSDNSRLAARVGERRNGLYTDMAQGVYSPCDLCEADRTAPPLWQIQAERVNHNYETHDLTYENAWMEFMGLPVFYMPYVSHPDPTVKRRSGLLSPTLGFGTTIGNSVKLPYYYSISQDQDVTISPTFSEIDGVQMAGEWRKRFKDGRVRLNTSGTLADLTEDTGDIRNDTFRGHIQGDAIFDLNEYWRTGGKIFLTSDDTYLKRYRIASPDILENQAYVEGFNKRDYATMEGFYFQDTRPGVRPAEPYVMPRIYAEKVSAPDATPLLGGRWAVTGEALSLARSGDSQDTRRLSSSVNWQRVDTAPTGIVSTLTADVRADTYQAENFVNPVTNMTQDNMSASRLFPYAEAQLSYPMARQFGSVQQTVEPIVAALVAPTVDDNSDIPNEDSLDFELDDTNLFSPNRFTGVDRQEGGSRITYGIKTGVYGFGGGSSNLFFGQSYRFNKDDTFAAGSGLEDQFSDYVGRLEIDPARWLFADYSFRLDKDSMQARKHDVLASVGNRPLRLTMNYLYIDEITGTTTGTSREEISGALTTYFDDYWSATAAQSRSIQPDSQPLTSSLSLAYNDECFNLGFTAQRDHTKRKDVDAGDSFYIRLLFKNLGGIDTPLNAGNVFNREDATR